MENTLENIEKSSQDYSIRWEDIENEDLNDEYDLDEIENFFREDYNENIIY